jgi:hypothetical protein
VLQDNLQFLANKCLPEETSDDEDESGSESNVLVQSFHNNLTPLGTHLGGKNCSGRKLYVSSSKRTMNLFYIVRLTCMYNT